MQKLLMISLLFYSLHLGAQSELPANPAATGEKVYEMFDVQTPPKYPGGDMALLKYVFANMQSSYSAPDSGQIPGKTIAAFVIHPDGHVSDIQIVKGEGPFGDELKRVLGTMPQWVPATVDGLPVSVRMTLPVQPEFDRSAPELKPSSVIRQLDSAAIWEGVRIKTAEVFNEDAIMPSFRIKKDKDKRQSLAAALEAQFQVNMSDDDVRSMKRAGSLADYIFRAQKGMIMFSKTGFKGKVERMITDRKSCGENGDCLNFIGAVIVPKGIRVTFYNRPGFKGEQMTIDATREEVRIASFLDLKFKGPVSTTNETVNWRESVQSVRFGRQ